MFCVLCVRVWVPLFGLDLELILSSFQLFGIGFLSTFEPVGVNVCLFSRVRLCAALMGPSWREDSPREQRASGPDNGTK